MNRPTVLRRSQMITPAVSVKLIEKGTAVDCDSLILDLEDAIAPAKKADARAAMRTALQELDFGDKEVGVRINGLASPWFLDDLLALEGLPIGTVVLPKVQSVAEVYAYDAMFRQLELRGGKPGISFQILIESARGLENVAAIAAASPRCETLIFGAGDFIADTGVAASRRGLAYARARIAAAAAGACLQALDHVHPGISDMQALTSEAAEAREIGYSGKWAIHPAQVPVINAAFNPSDPDIKRARRVIKVYEQALANGTGAVAFGGEMIDEATLKIARRCQAAALRTGRWDEASA